MSRLTAVLAWLAVYAFLVYDADMEDRDERDAFVVVTLAYLALVGTIAAVE